LASAQAVPFSRIAQADNAEVIADTAYGKIRGTAIGDVKAFAFRTAQHPGKEPVHAAG
jgi:hypothetical protein